MQIVNIFNIAFNEIYINDYIYFKNSECPSIPEYDKCNSEICGMDCSKHHTGWEQGYIALQQYPPSINPRGFTVGIVGTSICNVNKKNEHHGVGGLALVGEQYSIIPKPSANHWNNLGSIRRQQHEYTHLFGIHDEGNPCTKNQRCIMSGGFDYSTLDELYNIWCENCMNNIHNFVESHWE